ncbi:MAG: hypothetical protein ACI8P9_002586 [Parasphingorhabdus sp.]|jgi:hypothetical protein
MQSIDNLSEATKNAYQAFLDMSQSKTAHFGRLEELEVKYESGGNPSITENLELEKLLAEHDRNVHAFKSAFTAVVGSKEKEILYQLMSE